MRDGLTRRSLAASDGIDEKRTEIYYWWLLIAVFFEYARPASFVPGIAVLKLNSLIPLSLFVAVQVAKGLRPWEQIYGDRGSRWMTAYIGLVLISIPFAAVKVYANGRLLGSGSVATYRLPEGDHEITLVNESDGARSTQTIHIAQGQTVSISRLAPQ